MSLGNALFGKNKKILPKKTKKISKTVVPKNTNVFSGGVYETKKRLRGKLRTLRNLKINGTVLKKEEWTNMLTDLVRTRKGKITLGQLERDLYLKKHIGQRERTRIMNWAKKNFIHTDNNASVVNEKIKRKTNIPTVVTEREFVSPKQKSNMNYGRKVGEVNSLGMKEKGFQRGHGGSLEGVGKIKSSAVKPNSSQGLFAPGPSSVVGGHPKSLKDNNFNTQIRPRQGGI